MASNLALLVLLACFLLAAPAAYSDRRGFRATMTRTETTINFARAARRSYERMSMLAARLDASAAGGRARTQTPLQMDAGYTEYDMTISIGTPPQKLSALADTGSDLIWLKCGGACKRCTPEGSLPYFPNRSSSFSTLPCAARFCRDVGGHCSAGKGRQCRYTYYYGLSLDSHYYSQGFLGSETVTLGGGDAAAGVGFGCTTRSEGYFVSSSGVVGLGRGPLSLVSQLDAGAFSYCLPSDPSKSTPLLFGSAAALSSSGAGGIGIQTTPFLPNITDDYSVDLQRVSIGTATTPGPGRAGHGTVFDSGTTLTYLAEPAYALAKAAFLNQTTSLRRAAGRYGYEVCFRTSGGVSSAHVPKMTLHFDGAHMALPLENYFVEVDPGVSCWVVQKSPTLSIIGNFMQMDFHIRYDLDKAVLSFQPANCDSL